MPAAADEKTDTADTGDTTTADEKTADSKATAKADTTAAATATADAGSKGDAKTDETSTDAAKATKAAEDAKADPYASLALPKDSPLPADHLPTLVATAKALGLSREQAQKYVQHEHDQAVAAIGRVKADWDAIQTDPELGGAHFDVTQRRAQAGLRWMFGADEKQAREFFDTFGLSNNKTLVRGLAKLGAALAEDAPMSALVHEKPPERKETKDLMFPSSSSATKE